MSPVNRRIVLAARPQGAPRESDFRLETGAPPSPGDGQVLCRTVYLSLDPYMRGRMNEARSYTPPVEIGQTMVGGTVGRVLRSQAPGLAAGDFVMAYGGWQDYWVADGRALRKLDPAAAPLSTALGVLGMPGLTAYTGLLEIGRPRPGETLVVAAAAGAVGAIVGQIARIKGCRAVGVAGTAAKCDYVVNELGFDACVNHRAADFPAALRAACPDGIDIYFENVGGPVFDAVLDLLNDFARVPVCGLIAHYNATEPPPGPNLVPKLMRQVLVKRLNLRGFIVFDFKDREAEFLREVGGWLRQGRIKYREDVVEGLENAPQALIGLLQGKNFGKLIVRVAAEGAD